MAWEVEAVTEAVRPVVDKEGMTGGITGVEDPAEASNISIEDRALRSFWRYHDVMEP